MKDHGAHDRERRRENQSQKMPRGAHILPHHSYERITRRNVQAVKIMPIIADHRGVVSHDVRSMFIKPQFNVARGGVAIESRRLSRFRSLLCSAPLTDSIIGSAIQFRQVVWKPQQHRGITTARPTSFMFCLNVCTSGCGGRGREDTCVCAPRRAECAVCVLAFDLGVSRICATSSV